MTDIVVRLREGVFGGDETKTDAVINSHMQNAADEIERLRRERDAARRERDEAHYDAYRVVQQSLAAAKATGYGTGQRVPGTFQCLVVAMRVARDGRPWFEAVAEGAKVEAATSHE